MRCAAEYFAEIIAAANVLDRAELLHSTFPLTDLYFRISEVGEPEQHKTCQLEKSKANLQAQGRRATHLKFQRSIHTCTWSFSPISSG
ncbi:hypothetical protein Y1Q_0018672 [Alligator mississippiensis]|uniref:Uncharacterized protein n=1 Tax=Alligator mississippiensis TaxID=8496 RepID=A0A151NRW8_ALLMI|nr:hypothetical protein Y1Q_0018672 [Alligator mississippiensis]